MTHNKAETIEVLLVEDDEDHAELVRRNLLSPPGGASEARRACHITHINNGESALDYLHGRAEYADPASHSRPDLILLDLRLPRVDGLSVLADIKSASTLKSIPVVVLTSSAADPDVSQAYLRHANSYLVKPLDLKSFENLMKELGLYWFTWNQASPQ
ncbi:MAG: response regulator [Vicinamibacteria bacterium]